MTIGLNPVVLFVAAGLILALGAICFACGVRNWILKGSMILLAMALLLPAGAVFAPELVDARFRTYKRFYRTIEVGMTREEVLATLSRFYPSGGNRQKPKILEDSPSRLDFFMNPEHSREPNCEGIFLTMEEGRVYEKNYSPD